MALITDQDRKEEFDNLKEMLEALEIASIILEQNDQVQQTCMLICLPSEMGEEEDKEDLHMASAYLMQKSENEKQQTKYIAIYVPIQVELKDVDELELMKLVNEFNKTITMGSCFVGEEPSNGHKLVQIRSYIGGYVEDFVDEGVVCETVLELGALYDEWKRQLLELKGAVALKQEGLAELVEQ